MKPTASTTGQRLRDQGVAQVSAGHQQWLGHAQMLAHFVARAEGVVSSDSLREHGLPDPVGAHPNIWGALFRNIGLQPVGFKQTTRPQGRARMIRIYMLPLPGYAP